MIKRTKKFVAILLSAIVLLPTGISAKASQNYHMVINQTNLETQNYDALISKEEIRVKKINALYDQKQELHNQYTLSGDTSTLTKINNIESELSQLGVASYDLNSLNNKFNSIQSNGNIVTPNVTVPPNQSNITWSTYRYYTVIWGKLHEIQIVMAEPTLVRSGPLNSRNENPVTTVNYGNGIIAAALTAIDIAAGELAGKIPGGNVFKSLYDIAKNTSGALQSNQVVKSVEYNTTSIAAATFKYGFIKLDGQADWQQNYIYIGNSVIMSYQLTLSANTMVNGVVTPKFINHVETVTHKSSNYDNLSLRVVSAPAYPNAYAIYSINEPLRTIPFKVMGNTFLHYVTGPTYSEHGLNMYELYIYN